MSKKKDYFSQSENNLVEELNIIFDVILKLLNNYNKKNEIKVNKLFAIIEANVCKLDSSSLDMVVISCLEFKHNVKNKNISSKIDKLLNDICFENSEDYRFDIMKFLNYLIYKDKNIERLKIFLNSINKDLRNSKYYDDIFVTLLYNFDILDEEVRKYYYYVIIMLLDKMNRTLLVKNRERYIYILKNLTFSDDYSSDIVKLLNGEYIDNNDLISRFNMMFDFPYVYDGVNLIVNDIDIPNLKQYAITIDSENTIKRDDSIYFKKNKDNTYTLYVHVSYIPALVSYNSIMNDVAREREESIHVFNNIVSIYPNEFILNECSLNKNEYKSTVTYSIKLDNVLDVIPNTFKITRTNTKVFNNYSYSDINNIISVDGVDDVDIMVKYLAIFTLNSLNNGKLDVERLIGDNDFYRQTLLNSNKNISKELVRVVMQTVNYNVAKYFKDRNLPYLYKYSCWDNDKSNELNYEVVRNSSIQRHSELLNKLNESFFKIKLSEQPKKFFNLDCYSSSTDPLWQYSSSYNQYVTENLIFNKDVSCDLIEEWYNRTVDVACELNLQREKNKDIEIICKRLSRIKKI